MLSYNWQLFQFVLGYITSYGRLCQATPGYVKLSQRYGRLYQILYHIISGYGIFLA